MIITLFEDFRIMDNVILAISFGIRSDLLIKGLLQQYCNLDFFYICFINR